VLAPINLKDLPPGTMKEAKLDDKRTVLLVHVRV